MEDWFSLSHSKLGQAQEGYLKDLTITFKNILGQVARSYIVEKAFVSKRALPDFELDNDGEMAEVTYTIRGQDLIAGPSEA
jgi:hypothetical protein